MVAIREFTLRTNSTSSNDVERYYQYSILHYEREQTRCPIKGRLHG